MKLPRIQIILALALAGVVGALAQASRNTNAVNNNNVPGPKDYARFSAFVAERNIFDPERIPHPYGTVVKPRPRPTPGNRPTVNRNPAFTLVGTMAYEKGVFAFFSGTSSELKKNLAVAGQIAGYTVTGIAPGRAQLVSADKKVTLELNVGDVVRQENGSWQHAGASEAPAGGSETGAGPVAGSGGSATPSTPASSSEPNEILKRLMQLREQGN